MLEQQQQPVTPNVTTPNPNLKPVTDPTTNENACGNMSETTSTVMPSAGNSGVVAPHVVNDVIGTRLPENIPLHRCEVCNITCNSGDVLEVHQLGKKHLKNLQKKAESSAIVPKMPSQPSPTVDVSHEIIAPKVPPQPSPTTVDVSNEIIAPKMSPPQPAVAAASEALVGELEDTKDKLLQDEASVGTMIYCDICNVMYDDQDEFQKHVTGKKHSAKAIMQQLEDTNGHVNSTSENGSKAQSSSGGSVKIPAPFHCELCKVSCNSHKLFNMHMSGKKHLKKLKQSEEILDLSLTPFASLDTPESTDYKSVNLLQSNPMSCELCGITCTSYEVLKTHISGKKHQKNLEKSLKPIGPNPSPGTVPVATTPRMIGPLPHDGKMVNVDGNNLKAKRGGSHEDVETKKQKLLQEGGAQASARTCTSCKVVCSSSSVFISHLASKKHAKLALKQAEAQSN